MKTNLSSKQWAALAAFLALSTALVYCVQIGAMGSIDFELTGTVIDVDTKQPLEGAYVVAIYKDTRSSLARVAIFCIKTKGMYTGKDGKFHFPVEKRDGLSPQEVTAIKPGYFFKAAKFPQNAGSGRDWYTGRDILLKKHNPEDKNWTLGGEVCTEPISQEDVKANIEYFNIMLNEYLKYEARKDASDSIRDSIKRMERRP